LTLSAEIRGLLLRVFCNRVPGEEGSAMVTWFALLALAVAIVALVHSMHHQG
jgi:hypothetical protein